MPKTRAIRLAASINRFVITPTAGVPAFSHAMASCKLHEEQLPQSPGPVIANVHSLAASIISAAAGAL